MKLSVEEQHRLLAMREYLNLRAKIDDVDFEREILAASTNKLRDIHSQKRSSCGEDFVSNVASNLNIHFEEVRSPSDVTQLTKKYLEKKELGFGQLELELKSPDVDALLFKRQQEPNQYVAVLNLQETNSRAFWNKAHEVTHRLIEPPQKELFHRHRANQKNRIESIVDLVAAEVAFYKPIFKPIINIYSNSSLTWDTINNIKQTFSPTSSLLAVTKAVIKHWPIPAFLIQAQYRGRKGNLLKDPALRASVIDSNAHVKNSGVFFYSNMRAPISSPIHQTFTCQLPQDSIENLSSWTTSSGSRIQSREAFTSARLYDKGVLALVTLI